MKFQVLLAPFAFGFALLLAGCGIDYNAPSRITRYKPESYQKIKSWSVKLAYGNDVHAETSRSIRQDRSFCEDVSAWLGKDSATIRIDPRGEGCISVSIDEYNRWGSPFVVVVKLIDASGTVLSQMKIRDESEGGRTSFEHYVALHIIRELGYGPETK